MNAKDDQGLTALDVAEHHGKTAVAPRLDATEYVFPCYFLGDPNARPVRPRNLLGLTGVINQIRLTFDGTSPLVAPSGVLVVESDAVGARSIEYRRWDLNPHPLARTGF